MECKVCSHKLNKTNFAPRVLKCGHTVCDSCVVSRELDGMFEVSCGICNKNNLYAFLAIDCPLNLALMDIIEQESEASTDKCRIHGREFTKFCKHCKVATCDSCSKKEHSPELGCEECLLKEGLNFSCNDEKVLHLTHLANVYKEKKRRLAEMMKTSDQLLTCIRNDRMFLVHCLEDTDSFLEQIESLMKGNNKFTSIAEYIKHEKELEQFAKFDANVDNVCEFSCHPSSSLVLKYAKVFYRAVKEKLKGSKLAYLAFEGDGFRRIINKDGAFRVNLDKTETVFSLSELPMNSLKFKAESWPSYTFVIKFGGGEEIRLDVDLMNMGSEQLQQLFSMIIDGNSNQKAEFYMHGMTSLYFGQEDLSRSCIIGSFDSNRSVDEIHKSGVNFWKIYVAKKTAIVEEECTKVDQKKLAILAYYDQSKCIYGYYFMRCGIGLIGKDITLIGYHEMNDRDVIPETSYANWSAELEIF